MEDTNMTFANQGNSDNLATSIHLDHTYSPEEEAVASPEGFNVPGQEAELDELSCKLNKLHLTNFWTPQSLANNQVSQHGQIEDIDGEPMESSSTNEASSVMNEASQSTLSGAILPPKVLRRIFKYAMTSDEQPIEEGDSVDPFGPYPPTIAFGALLVK
ncbi:MAG: hypothetical protein Q9167_006457 [Letrouitia subvulpina]